MVREGSRCDNERNARGDVSCAGGARIFKRGYEKAVELLNKGEGIFAWAPSLRKWLRDPDYVFWLGAGSLRIAI